MRCPHWVKPLAFLSLIFLAEPLLAKPRVLAVGDSLTAGYGVAAKDAYPALLETRMRKSGWPEAVVVNAGTSGATSAFGVRTMKFHFRRQKPDLVIYALGANDGLRGISPKETEQNIEEALKLAQKEKVPVVLAGMKAPPNYGPKFPKEFEEIYPRLAKKYKVTLIPFLLEGVAGNPALNQADGIHPNEKGYVIIADHMLAAVKKVL